MNIKDIRDKINAEQKHWAEGSPQWNNLELAKESLEPAEIKRTKQQLEVGYNQDVKQQKTNKRNNDVAKVDINSYVEQLQNATPEERQEIFDQLAEMVNNGSIPVEAVGTLMTDFVTQYRGNGGKGVILKKYGDIESDVKEFVGKINPKKRDKLIDAYLDADPNNMVSCGQIFGREASDAILKRRQAALSNNQKYLGKYRGENTPKPDDGCATISDRITKNECARGSQNQNK